MFISPEKYTFNFLCNISKFKRHDIMLVKGHYYWPNNKTYMGIILWIIFGALVGWVASLIMKTDAEQGALLNVVVGVIGAIVGGWIMSSIGQTAVTGFNIYSFLVALLGAIVLIGLVKAVRRA